MSGRSQLPSVVAAVVAAGPGHAPHTIAASPWLEAADSEIERLYASFAEQFSTALSECSRILGTPRERMHSLAPSWYPECIQFASWRVGTSTAYLAVVHHDQETPVVLELGLVSPAEIAERTK